VLDSVGRIAGVVGAWVAVVHDHRSAGHTRAFGTQITVGADVLVVARQRVECGQTAFPLVAVLVGAGVLVVAEGIRGDVQASLLLDAGVLASHALRPCQITDAVVLAPNGPRSLEWRLVLNVQVEEDL